MKRRFLAQNGFPPCPFHWLTGYHCPGCGTLRACHQMLNGNLAGALSMNPLMVISIPILGLAMLGKGPVYRAFRHPAGAWACAAILMLYWVLRNIPVAPFSWLAPG